VQARLAFQGLALTFAQHAPHPGGDVTPNASIRAALGTATEAQPAQKFSGPRAVK